MDIFLIIKLVAAFIVGLAFMNIVGIIAGAKPHPNVMLLILLFNGFVFGWGLLAIAEAL